ncbi:MAG: WbuC family cupin fold metalloprotein [Candidatus Egerieousia sp.]
MIINDKLLDEIALRASESPRLRMNKDMRNGDKDMSQRMLNVLLPGTAVPVHRHRNTSETTMIIRGKLYMVFYNDIGAQTERVLLDPTIGNYGVQIPAGQWHTVEVLEPSVIFEVKDGPYMPSAPEDIMY